MEVHGNIFSKGLNQDIAADKVQEGVYYDCLNGRIITSIGDTSGNVENIKGNTFKIAFPEVSSTYSITASLGDAINDITVTVNGTVVTLTGISNTLESISEAINTNTTFINLGVVSYVGTTIGSTEPDVLYITMLDSGTITLFNITGSTWTFTSTLYSPTVSAVRLIGWTVMRDDIILLTEGSGVSQIWKLTYDKVTLDCTLDLLYNNYLGFSIDHPVANPGMIESRYETPSIQNIYWTNNYDAPKKFNVADPLGYAIDPTNFSIAPIVSPFIPNPQKINQTGGQLKTGIHQIAYRLGKETGGKTQFFLPSYPLWIVPKNEEESPVVQHFYNGAAGSGSSFFDVLDEGYCGGPSGNLAQEVTTAKSITFKIERMDLDYDIIEIAHIYRKTYDGVPEINIVSTEGYTQDTVYFTLTGDEPNPVEISLDEFNGRIQSFDRVGTIASKDNYLFLGDVTLSQLDLDWDARAYRFNSSQQARLINQDGSNAIVLDGSLGTPTWSTVPEDHDCINVNDSPIPSATGNYLYQSDGTTLGGEGPNVKYTFTTESVTLDDNVPYVVSGDAAAPFKSVGKGTSSRGINSTTDINQSWDSSDTFKNYLSPYLAGFLKGYQRDEIYRFGIVFYDLNGQPGFVKWIADIRMPHVWMPSGTNPYDRTKQFQLTTYTNDVLTADVLGVRFEISGLESYVDQITGYSIVRARRTAEDRTILGQGAFVPADHNSGAADVHHIPLQNANHTVTTDWSSLVAGFHSPEFCFPNSLTQKGFLSGDQIDIIGIYESDYQSNMMNDNGGPLVPEVAWPVGGLGSSYIIKNYEMLATCDPILDNALGASLTPYDLNATKDIAAWFASGGGVQHIINGLKVSNHSRLQGPSGVTAGNGNAGSRTLALAGDFTAFGSAGNDYVVTDGVETTSRTYFANYKRPRVSGYVSTQYSGNSFAQRSKQEYISTNHYQPIFKGASYPLVNAIYGGDTYICIFDKWHHMFDDGTGGGASTHWLTKLYPVETMLNVEMRQAVTPHSHQQDNMGFLVPNKYFVSTAAPRVWDEFMVNQLFSIENNVRKFFPKPEPFLENSEFDCRIYNNSQPKINGETFDSWTTFKVGDYYQLDSKFGKLTSLINHRDKIHFFQDRGMGIYQVNEKSLIQDLNGAQLALGSGGVGERADYISNSIGAKHRFGFAQSSYTLIFFDIMTKKLYGISDQLGAISDLQGLSGFLNRTLIKDILTEDNPYLGAGITSTYDHKYNEFRITFHDKRDTRYVEGLNILCDSNFDSAVETLGADLVVNGNFTPNPMPNLNILFSSGTGDPYEADYFVIDEFSDWTINPAVRAEISSGLGLLWYNCSTVQVGERYLVGYEMEVTSGAITTDFDGQVLANHTTGGAASYAYRMTYQGNAVYNGVNALTLVFSPTVTSSGYVDNVYIKPLSYTLSLPCWGTTGTLDFYGNKVTKLVAGAATLYQDVSALVTIPGTYKVKFKMSGYQGAGNVSFRLCDTDSTSTYSADGTYEETITINGLDTGRLTFNFSADFKGSLYDIQLVPLTVVEEAYNNSFTLVWNELLKAFTAFYSGTPRTYINDKYHIFTPYAPSATEHLYMEDTGNRGEFYGTVYPFSISFIVAPNYTAEKIFDNMLLNSKTYDQDSGTQYPVIVDDRTTFDQFMVYNTYQNTGPRNIDGTCARFIKRKWNIAIGGNRLATGATNIFDYTGLANKAYTERIKSNYIYTKLIYNNTDNKRLVLESVITKYRLNPTT